MEAIADTDSSSRAWDEYIEDFFMNASKDIHLNYNCMMLCEFGEPQLKEKNGGTL